MDNNFDICNGNSPVMIEMVIYSSTYGVSSLSSHTRYYLIRSGLTVYAFFSKIEFDLQNFLCFQYDKVTLFCRGRLMEFSSNVQEYVLNRPFIRVYCLIFSHQTINYPDNLLESQNTPPYRNIFQLFSENIPQFQNFMESHPEVHSALSSSDTNEILQQLIRNPSRLNDFMMRHDQELRNIESLPGGYSALERLYWDIQEPLQNVFEDIIPGEYTDSERNLESHFQCEINAENRRPLQNPWESNNVRENQVLGNSFENLINNQNPEFVELFAQVFLRRMSQTHPSSNLDGQNSQHPPLHDSQNSSFPLRNLDHLEQRFSIQMDTLLNMGFTDRNKNLEALSISNGDIDLAVNILLSQ